MHGEDAFKVEGTVLEVMNTGVLRVALSNGHTLVAYATKKTRGIFSATAPGARVRVQVSPFDLSKGRLILE